MRCAMELQEPKDSKTLSGTHIFANGKPLGPKKAHKMPKMTTKRAKTIQRSPKVAFQSPNLALQTTNMSSQSLPDGRFHPQKVASTHHWQGKSPKHFVHY